MVAEPWFQPTHGTTDLYSNCSEVGNHVLVDVPSNYFGYQFARSGNNYSGFYSVVFFDSIGDIYREYIEVKLLSQLQQGKRYFVRFYLSLAETSARGTGAVGAYFSFDSIIESTFYNLSVVPQIENLGQFIKDKTIWIQVAGSFIATGGEKFLTIGNFYDNENTDTVWVSGGIAFPQWAYYYLDDVCVSQDSSECDITGIQNLSPNAFSLFPNPATTQINLELPISKSGNLIVTNILCEEVMRQPISFTTKSLSLNIESLAKGTYFISLKNEHEVTTTSFIKQ
ncbi:MAG: T9SS type A sorting domain-containing protein [Chitinophagales bacterium]|nr:T9SS type A sorting domain-containing protein [Chitinophagales bacterium]